MATETPAQEQYDAPVPEFTQVWKCTGCEHVHGEDADFDTLYECSSCGGHGFGSDNRRCGDCNRFMAKVSEHGCPECEEAECEQVSALYDEDDEEWIEEDEWRAEHHVPADGETKRESKRQREERERQERAAKARAREQAVLDAVQTVPATSLRAGMCVVPEGRWSPARITQVNVYTETRVVKTQAYSIAERRMVDRERVDEPHVMAWGGGVGFRYALDALVDILSEEDYVRLFPERNRPL